MQFNLQSDNMNKMLERRKNERIPVMLKVEYTFGEEPNTGFSLNLSRGGIFINSNNIGIKGQFIRLKFSLPGGKEPVSVLGEIVRTTDTKDLPSGMGIMFKSQGSKVYDRVNSFIKEYCDNQICSTNFFKEIWQDNC